MATKKFIDIHLDQDQIRKQLKGASQEVNTAFFGSLATIHSFTSMTQLAQHNGLNWEKLENKFYPGTKLPMYSFRITVSWRALCLLRTGPVIEIVGISNHDGAY